MLLLYTIDIGAIVSMFETKVMCFFTKSHIAQGSFSEADFDDSWQFLGFQGARISSSIFCSCSFFSDGVPAELIARRLTISLDEVMRMVETQS